MSAEASAASSYELLAVPAAAAGVRAPIWTKLLAVAVLMPEDLNIRPAGLLLTMPRLVLVAAVPFIATRMLSGAKGGFRFVGCDWMFAVTGLWMFLAICMNSGVDRAVVSASILVLEFCGTYFLTRASLRERGQAAALARFLAVAIAIEGALSVIDVVTQRHVLHELAQALTGYPRFWRPDYRNGLMRAQGSLEHPILMGAVCAFGALLSLTMLRGAVRVLAFAGGLTGVLAAVSSAPIGAMALSLMLLAFRRATPGVPNRWRLTMSVFAPVLAALILFHPRPFSFLMDHLTFDPQTGYYRLLIWNIVGGLVLANPVFGLGIETDFAVQFDVSNTIDSLWLYSALSFGIPGSCLIGLALLSSCQKGQSRPGRPAGDDTALGLALGIIIFLYIYLGFTVHFWGTAWILLAMFAGMRSHFGDAAARAELEAEQRGAEAELLAPSTR